MADITDPARDVLPPALNQGMAALWILLLGGRWVGIQWLLVAGILQPQQVRGWDEGILLRAYLILLAITLVVLALRSVRGASSPSDVGSGPDDRSKVTAGLNPPPAIQPMPEAYTPPEKGKLRD